VRAIFRPRRLISIGVLTAAWCALWGSVSFANVASGGVVAAVVTSGSVATPGVGGIRIVSLVRLTGLVAMDLVKSTASVATEILTPTDRTNESIIAYQLPAAGRDHLLLMVVAITLTPGTAVVDADPDAGLLYLHLLHDQRRQETIDHVEELGRLACDALPVRTLEASR